MKMKKNQKGRSGSGSGACKDAPKGHHRGHRDSLRKAFPLRCRRKIDGSFSGKSGIVLGAPHFRRFLVAGLMRKLHFSIYKKGVCKER